MDKIQFEMLRTSVLHGLIDAGMRDGALYDLVYFSDHSNDEVRCVHHRSRGHVGLGATAIIRDIGKVLDENDALREQVEKLAEKEATGGPD